MKLKILLTVILLTVISSDAAPSVVSIGAINTDTDSTDLRMNISGIPTGGSTTAWFEYGPATGKYPYMTKKVTRTTNGSYTKTIESFPLVAGQTYHYRSMITNVVGNSSSFTLSDVTNITGYDFDPHYEELSDSNFNVTEVATVLPKPFEDVMGTIFWGMFFGMIFVAMWIRQDGDVTNPALVGIISSFAMFSLLPEDWLKVGYALLIISIAGLITSIIFKK